MFISRLPWKMWQWGEYGMGYELFLDNNSDRSVASVEYSKTKNWKIEVFGIPQENIKVPINESSLTTAMMLAEEELKKGINSSICCIGSVLKQCGDGHDVRDYLEYLKGAVAELDEYIIANGRKGFEVFEEQKK